MKLIRIFIIGIALIGMNSCGNNFLDLVPFTSENSGNFYNTEVQLNQAITGVYSYFRNYTSNAYILEEEISDNTKIDNATGNGVLSQWAAQEAFQLLGSDWVVVRDSWRLIYKAISETNFVLSKLPNADVPADVKSRMEGELRFIRAYYYFVAVRYWGGVPLVTEPITIQGAFSRGRASVDEVYAQIIDDLNKAAGLLPTGYTGLDVGRATKGAALTLLGSVYLTKGDWDNAITTLREVVALGVYQLEPNYADLWNPSKKNGKESVFEVQFMQGETYGLYNNFQYNFAPYFGTKSVVQPYKGGGRNIPTKDLMRAYEPGDKRFNASIVLDTITNNYSTGTYITFVVGSCIKYNGPQAVVLHGSNDWYLLRYSEVLLMLSEALNEKVFNTESFSLINQVRSRSGLPDLTQATVSNQAAFRLAMEKERRIEFAFENKRWFDLRRTGRALEVMTAFGQIELADPTTPATPTYPLGAPGWFDIKPYHLLFPLPNDEIVLYDIGQNPGY
jgi:starch-binding outer membrane protein, SusD/RagB family